MVPLAQTLRDSLIMRLIIGRLLALQKLELNIKPLPRLHNPKILLLRGQVPAHILAHFGPPNRSRKERRRHCQKWRLRRMPFVLALWLDGRSTVATTGGAISISRRRTARPPFFASWPFDCFPQRQHSVQSRCA
jgi:hypothetical protein